jgi:hypothetical protein
MTLFWQVACDVLIFKTCVRWRPLQIGVKHSSGGNININHIRITIISYFVNKCFQCKKQESWKREIYMTRWENFIRIGITVLYLKSCQCQLWIWRSQISVLLALLRVVSKTAFATKFSQRVHTNLETYK